jgi:very-short-patch-repair endonuclease
MLAIRQIVDDAPLWGHNRRADDESRGAITSRTLPGDSSSAFLFGAYMKMNEIEFIYFNGYKELCSSNPVIRCRYNSFSIKPIQEEVFSAFDIKIDHISGDYPFTIMSHVGIYPQYKIERYRPDFILGGNINKIGFSVIVEIDGHDWHEKTVSQAIRDKKRERDLICLGNHIIRFSGTEVKKNPVECASESLKCYLSIWENIIVATSETE